MSAQEDARNSRITEEKKDTAEIFGDEDWRRTKPPRMLQGRTPNRIPLFKPRDACGLRKKCPPDSQACIPNCPVGRSCIWHCGKSQNAVTTGKLPSSRRIWSFLPVDSLGILNPPPHPHPSSSTNVWDTEGRRRRANLTTSSPLSATWQAHKMGRLLKY